MGRPKKLPVYNVLFESQYKMTSTFLRFQEHYESPEFAGKIFTLEEYMDWYADKNGNFTYLEDWNGFNIPCEVLTPFYRGKFDPLTKKEKALLKMFKKVRGKFYIIGTVSGSDSVLKHELVHSLFYTDIMYSIKVGEALKMFDKRRLWKALTEMGYMKDVILDEMNAYAITDWCDDLKEHKSHIMEVTLKQTFFRHFGLRIDNEEDVKKLLSRIHHWKFRMK